MSINPFFSKWEILKSTPNDVEQFSWFLDTVGQKAYHRPMITTDGLTRPARYFLNAKGAQIPLLQLERHYPSIKGGVFVQARTMDGNILIAAPRAVATDSHALAAAAYKTYAVGKAPATRKVEPSDRQIHWVWFRRTPSWRLDEEIVLRAASWIELNPGYTFHLWTNLADSAELADFLADLPADVRDRYFVNEGGPPEATRSRAEGSHQVTGEGGPPEGTRSRAEGSHQVTGECGPKIQVHFADEFRATVFDWLAANVNAETQTVFADVWISKERQNIVMKTDYTRNILLAVHGGIYTDFNDLVCMEPIEPFLEAHAGNFTGVTDNTSDNNASNYFLYAGKDNTEWCDITRQCTETLPKIYAAIYSADALATARDLLQSIMDGRSLDLTAVQTVLDACPIGSSHSRIQTKHFLYTVCMALEFALGSTTAAGGAIRGFLQPNTHNRMKATFQMEVVSLLTSLRAEVAPFLVEGEGSERFATWWRFARTDMYLNPIMHSTNLPIYCREQKIPIWMPPYSYLLRYACLLSFVGHLGDGSSYGMDPTRRTTMRRLLGVA
jgi:hypothetical protein